MLYFYISIIYILFTCISSGLHNDNKFPEHNELNPSLNA